MVRVFRSAGVCLLLLVMATASQAGIISLGSASLADLLGPTATPTGDLLVTDMTSGRLQAEVYSQAFTNDEGDFVYLYQVNNIGTQTDSSIELFTLYPFDGAGSSPVLGSLTGTLPVGFLPNSQLPENQVFFDVDNTVSFYFTARFGAAITPGENSTVMYAASSYAPGLITGNLIGSMVGTGEIVGPAVPEPSSLALIGLGIAALVLSRRFKR